MIMKNISNTNTFVQVLKKSKLKKFSIPLTLFPNNTDYQFVLVITSSTKNYVRISMYPLKNKNITKLKICGEDVTDKFLNNAMGILKKYNVIHTSGLLEVGEQFTYECYLNMDLESSEMKELKKTLDSIINSSTLFSMEKIKIKK